MSDNPDRPVRAPRETALFNYSKNYRTDMHPTFHFSEGYAAAEKSLAAELAAARGEVEEMRKAGVREVNRVRLEMEECNKAWAEQNSELKNKIAALEKESYYWRNCHDKACAAVEKENAELRALAKELRDALVRFQVGNVCKDQSCGCDYGNAAHVLTRANQIPNTGGDE